MKAEQKEKDEGVSEEKIRIEFEPKGMANRLIKKSITFEEIINQIESANKCGEFKTHIPHWVFINEQVKLKLIQERFKVYVGDWDGIIKDCLIIEW